MSLEYYIFNDPWIQDSLENSVYDIQYLKGFQMNNPYYLSIW